MPSAITEQKFNDLKAKLRELFELDKSDLDFGIYRIMAAKNREVTEFLDRQLRDVVSATLADHGVGAQSSVQTELDKVIAGLKAADMGDDESAASTCELGPQVDHLLVGGDLVVAHVGGY